MKILVTHEFPHLDDIAAIWLFQRYNPTFRKAKIEFVRLKGGGEAITYKNKPVDQDPNIIHFGVGKGRYDEHKGDVGICATMLVYKDLLKEKLIPKEDKLGIEKLVEYVNLQDTGRITDSVYPAMYVPVLLRNIENSQKRFSLGIDLIELALITFKNEAQLEHDWKSRKEFQSKWGKAVVFTTPASGADWLAYKNGFELVIHIDPVRGWKMFRSPAESKVDLSETFETVKKLDPTAGWFLHHSHHLLMCGSRSAPDVVRSKLSTEQLISAVQ